MMRRLGTGCALPFIVLVACSGSVDGEGAARRTVDAPAFCQKLITECKDTSATQADCEKSFASLRVNDECADTFRTATCPNLTGRGGICFPACTGNAQTCNGDGTITTCSSDRSLTLDCASVCTGSGKSYTGTCGPEFNGQKSQDGRSRCWCQ